MSSEEPFFTPGRNSWATGGSATRTKTECYPVLQPLFLGTSSSLAKPSSPSSERVLLEVAAGFGEHVAYFAENTPTVKFQPTEAQNECVAGIADHAATAVHKNILPPQHLNVLAPAQWDAVLKASGPFDGIYMFNMLHISPWESTVFLFEQAQKVLKKSDTPGTAFLAVYGTFKRNGEFSGEGDRLFDLDLKRRDERWGIRDLESQIFPEAEKNGFKLKERHEMNYNNLLLVWTL
ncbi:hypothetical protein BZA70DRAFT_292290 [Myxozyma melibiosi]|uniref:Methyltransferase domain-containing protein n=1 Tax=Myxozyma melibiosi TaxID=54550 RepID=A0ABR1EXS3_9ASCO